MFLGSDDSVHVDYFPKSADFPNRKTSLYQRVQQPNVQCFTLLRHKVNDRYAFNDIDSYVDGMSGLLGRWI